MSSDFDFLIGHWNVVNTRLKNWLCGCADWVTFESQHVEQKSNTGQGTFAIHRYVKDNTEFERSVLRQYDTQLQFWKIDRLDAMSALSMPSLKGTFWSNKGSFLTKGWFQDQEVLVWVEWTNICRNYAYWEQALSKDNGRTWEVNWIMEFFKDRNRS